MSGEDLQGMQWFISIGNIISILISITVVIGSIVGLVRYLRKSVTKEIIGMRAEMKTNLGYIDEKLAKAEQTADREYERDLRRMDEIKSMIRIYDERLKELREDVNEGFNTYTTSIRDLHEKLSEYREEYHKLELKIREDLAKG